MSGAFASPTLRLLLVVLLINATLSCRTALGQDAGAATGSAEAESSTADPSTTDPIEKKQTDTDAQAATKDGLTDESQEAAEQGTRKGKNPTGEDSKTEKTSEEVDSATGDDAPETKTTPNRHSVGATLNLPARDQTGRPIRPIGFYLSQIVQVVPKDFRPISIDELLDSLSAPSDSLTDPDQARLLSGFYDIRLDGDALISQRSELVIEHDPGLEIRRRLGDVNLALVQPASNGRGTATPPASPLPHLEVDQDGQLIAVIRRPDLPNTLESDAESASGSNDLREGATEETEADSWRQSIVRFNWTLQGRSIREGKRFELRLPRTSQTRLVLSTPADIALESRQGVLVERPGPPPGADVETRSGDIRWYVLEAGGLNRVELIARRQIEDDSIRPYLIRRGSKQYDIDLTGVSWSQRMTIELPQPRDSLSFLLPVGMVTDVRVNSVQAPYRGVARQGGGRLLEIDLPTGFAGRPERSSNGSGAQDRGVESRVDLVTLTVQGKSEWELKDGFCNLPSLLPTDSGVIWTEASTQATVTVLGPLDVTQWELPPSWKQSIQRPAQEDESILIAEGPPWRSGPSSEIWSRIKLAEKGDRFIDEVWMRLSLQQTPSNVVQSAVRIRCRLLQNQQSPLPIEINPDWTLDSVTIVGSGRRIVTPAGSKELIIWPTPSESAQANFEIEVLAQRALTRSSGRIGIPSTWIVRPKQRVASHLISIEPPPLRRWDANSVMLAERMDQATLDEEATAFFQPTSETVLLRSAIGQVPAVTLEPIDVSFGVTLQHLIKTEEGGVSETIVVRAETTQPIPSLAVLTGSADKTEFNWALRRTDQSATVSLPDSAIDRPSDDPLGTYQIQLAGRDLRQYELVGQRVFAAGEELTLSLPSVRRARSQNAEVLLDSSWEVVDVPRGVQLVPGINGADALESAGEYAQHLRYDPGLRPAIRLRRASADRAACIIWDQRFEVVANSRSEDLFYLSAEVSSRKPIRIRFDDELEIMSVTRNGVAYPTRREETGRISIVSENQNDRVGVLFRRRHASGKWLRRCEIPTVEIEGHTIRSRTSYQAATGTILLFQGAHPWSSLLGEDEQRDSTIASAELILMPRHLAIGLGWLASIMIFGLAWATARWFSLGIHSLFVLFVLSASGAVIWWPWQLAILGWISLPIAAAGMLHAVITVRSAPTSSTNSRGASGRPTDDTRSQRDTGSQRDQLDRSTDFSVTIPSPVILMTLGIALALTGEATAQNGPTEDMRRGANAASGRQDPIELLVPLDNNHARVGDKVYLSRTDFESVRAEVDPDRPVNARFQSADYRVVLSATPDATEPVNAEIQATYQIYVDRQATRIRLPIAAESLKRIEWLSDGETQILRDTVDERGMVVVTIPASRQIRLRLTLLPTLSAIEVSGESGTASELIGNAVTLSGATDPASLPEAPATDTLDGRQRPDRQATEVRLAIPPIHSAKLIVESPPEILVTSIGTPLGRTRFRDELGRYEADLGPIKELSIACRTIQSNSAPNRQRIRRAYRIEAGIDDTIVECEIRSVEPSAAGDAIQLTILGSAPTNVLSRGWVMERSEDSDDVERPQSASSNSAGGIYRFINQSGTDSPIRLLWQIPSILNDPTSTSDSEVMQIPEVFASSSSRSLPTLFALHASPSVRISELADKPKSVSVDDFLSVWNGYPGKIGRAFVVPESFPSFKLFQDKYVAPSVELNHHLHVAPARMRLTLQAKVFDPRPGIRRVSLTIPDRFRLINCKVNKTVVTALDWETLDTNTGTQVAELPLGDQRIDGENSIEVVAESDATVRGQWKLPQFSLSSDGAVTQAYRITRDRSLDVEIIPPSSSDEKSGTDEQASADEQASSDEQASEDDRQPRWPTSPMTRADLLAGQIPVASSDSPQNSRLRIKRRPAGVVFKCDQVTRMRYADGQWFCDTLLEIPTGRLPDYVDIELPTRWAMNLDVIGAKIWDIRESTDSVITVVRVSLADSTEMRGEPAGLLRRVQITGGLNNRDQSRVSVPSINVLGAGARTALIAVPDQLTTESIQWRTQSVRALKPGSVTFEHFQNTSESADRYSFYAPIERRWSIELEPLSQATVEPVAFACDARIFLDGDRALVLQRFDILPETLSEVVLALPPSATCIGVWCAGREIDLQAIGAKTNADQTDSPDDVTKIRVPLAYSRLPQALEVLVEVPVENRELADYLTVLLEVPTRLVWAAYYQAPIEDQVRRLRIAPDDDEAQPTLAADSDQREERAFDLAGSAVMAIDRARDMLAERSDEEIERWLLPWIERYQSIASSNGHQLRIADPADVEEPADPASVSSSADNSWTRGQSEARWAAYDEKLLGLSARFLQTDPKIPSPLFDQRRFADFELVAVEQLQSFEDPPALTQGFTRHKSLQTLLVNAITLITFGLAIILLWPFRGRFKGWVAEPALWLFIIGFLGVFLIPFPVAAMLMIVAVTVPLINRVQSAGAR